MIINLHLCQLAYLVRFYLIKMAVIHHGEALHASINTKSTERTEIPGICYLKFGKIVGNNCGDDTVRYVRLPTTSLSGKCIHLQEIPLVKNESTRQACKATILIKNVFDR